MRHGTQDFHAILIDLLNVGSPYLISRCPSSSLGNSLCCPLCAQVNLVVIVDVPLLVHTADERMQMRDAAV